MTLNNSRQKSPPIIDVLMCVGEVDINRLMIPSLLSCLENFALLGKVIIATSAKEKVLNILKKNNILEIRQEVVIFDDSEILPKEVLDLPGWWRQQYIRLNADKLCTTKMIACLSSDTIMFKPTNAGNLLHQGKPILFYNRYEHTTKHLKYERQRIESISRLLQVKPLRSWRPGDFIMDFMLFESKVLKKLREYLSSVYGGNALFKIISDNCGELEKRGLFGEWTLYAVFLLDVLNETILLKNSENRFIAQVHSLNEFKKFHFDPHIVHFVDKSIDLSLIQSHIHKWSLTTNATARISN